VKLSYAFSGQLSAKEFFEKLNVDGFVKSRLLLII